ncbi:hypothetical protein [Actinoplanes sp. NPDC051851]|uniref:hypothetical protein n=1 Tax=Actinoplanes sp. NPDC051851 TaxID=3154753 RepID=UPI00341F0A5B
MRGRTRTLVTAVALLLVGAAGFAVTYRGGPWRATSTEQASTAGVESPSPGPPIDVVGGHFTPWDGEVLDSIVAFPTGHTPRITGDPRTCADLLRSLRSQGGYDSTRSYVHVTIHASRPVEIRIANLRPHVLATPKPDHVIPVTCEPAPDTPVTRVPEEVLLSLDDEAPSTDYPQAWLQRTPHSGDEFRLTRGGGIHLLAGEQAEIEFGVSQGPEADWELRLGLLIDGDPQGFTVRDGNEPFHYAPNTAESGFLWCASDPGRGLLPDDGPDTY